MNGFYIVVAIGSIISILVTFFLGRAFKEKALVRYIPAIISALFVIGFYIKSRYYSEGMEGLGYVILVLIACIVFFVSFITAFIMGLVRRRNR